MHSPRLEHGASAVEYGLMLAAIATVIIVIVFGLGQVTKSLFTATSSCFEAGPAAGC